MCRPHLFIFAVSPSPLRGPSAAKIEILTFPTAKTFVTVGRCSWNGGAPCVVVYLCLISHPPHLSFLSSVRRSFPSSHYPQHKSSLYHVVKLRLLFPDTWWLIVSHLQLSVFLYVSGFMHRGHLFQVSVVYLVGASQHPSLLFFFGF